MSDEKAGAGEGSTDGLLAIQRLDEILTARLARCVAIEQRLLNMAGGKEPLPNAETCREMALKLGVPDDMR